MLDFNAIRQRAAQHATMASAANWLMEPSPVVSQLAALAGVAQARRPYGLSAADADRCHAPCWDDREIVTFTSRVMWFLRRDVPGDVADNIAEALALRDRDGDDRRLCLECAHLAGRVHSDLRCKAGRGALSVALITTPIRCEDFTSAGGRS